jgi:hypothetical protein
MTEITSFREVVELWGAKDAHGARIAMASEVGASAGVVAKWWQRDFIPPEYWPAVTSTDKARETGVTAELLARLAASRKLASAETAEARA